MSTPKIHKTFRNKHGDPPLKTECGRSLDSVPATDDAAQVTCGSCLRAMNKQPRAYAGNRYHSASHHARMEKAARSGARWAHRHGKSMF